MNRCLLVDSSTRSLWSPRVRVVLCSYVCLALSTSTRATSRTRPSVGDVTQYGRCAPRASCFLVTSPWDEAATFTQLTRFPDFVSLSSILSRESQYSCISESMKSAVQSNCEKQFLLKGIQERKASCFTIYITISMGMVESSGYSTM